MGARRAQATGRTAAIAASLLAHAGLLAFIAWQLTRTPEPALGPVMQVALIPRLPTPPRPEPIERSSPKAVASVSGRSRPRLHRPSALAEPAPVAPAPTLPGSAEPQAWQVLRGLLGCRNADLAGLDDAERERCLSRLAKESPEADRTRFNLDPQGLYAGGALPYLPRRPTRGCKARLTGDAGVMDKQGARAGFTCVKPF